MENAEKTALDASMADISRKIIDLLPDDPAAMLSVLVLSYASCVVETGRSDRVAFAALGMALKEARSMEVVGQ